MVFKLLSKCSPKGIIPAPTTATFPLMLVLLDHSEHMAVDVQAPLEVHFPEYHFNLATNLNILGFAHFRNQTLILATSLQVYHNRHNRCFIPRGHRIAYAEGVDRSFLAEFVFLKLKTHAGWTDVVPGIGDMATLLAFHPDH